jgi:hypothetical protein
MVFAIGNILNNILNSLVDICFLWLQLRRSVTIKSEKFFMKPFKFILLEVFGVDAF